MGSAIDAHPGRPFDPAFITPVKVPRRADIDPWAFWTYEDCIMSTGLYMDALMRQYAVTGEARCLERCRPVYDYDGDGLSDLAVFGAADGRWDIRRLDGTVLVWDTAWGGTGFRPVE